MQKHFLSTCILDLGEGSCDCESISDDHQTRESENGDRMYEWLGCQVLPEWVSLIAAYMAFFTRQAAILGPWMMSASYSRVGHIGQMKLVKIYLDYEGTG